MDASDRYQLALCVLDNEPEAHLILADLLEEEGEPGSAAFARRAGDDLADRLAAALCVLPMHAMIRLGCNFVEHLLDRRPGLLYEVATRDWLRDGLRALRQWAAQRQFAGQAQGDYPVVKPLHDILWPFDCETAWRASPAPTEMGKALRRLADSVRALLKSQEQFQQGQPQAAERTLFGSRSAWRDFLAHLQRAVREADLVREIEKRIGAPA
jgi:hypothetical protein